MKLAPDRCAGCKYFECDACWVNPPSIKPNPLTGEDELRREAHADKKDLACEKFSPVAH
jgi:hypothetical protein